jgi:hypothetical protein
MPVVVPDESGIYLAQPIASTPVPVTRDPRYVDTCARVTNSNLKVGKAKSLNARYNNYLKDFGQENILFTPLLLTESTTEAETVILRRLKQFRKRSPKGGLMDWLERITTAEAISEILDVLDQAGIPYEQIPASIETVGRTDA